MTSHTATMTGYRGLAVAVLVRAVRDALRGDLRARKWVSDPAEIQPWCEIIGQDAEVFATRAAIVLSGVAA